MLTTLFKKRRFNRPYSYSRYRTGTSLQVRLMRGSLFKYKLHSTLFNDIPPHEPPLQASSSPILRIRIWPIPTVETQIQIFELFKMLRLTQECIKYRVCLSNKSNRILPQVAVSRNVHSWECLLRELQLYNKINRENTLYSKTNK